MKRVIPLLLAILSFSFASLTMASHHRMSPEMPSLLPIDEHCSISTGTPVIDYGIQSRWQLQDASNSQMLTPGKRVLMLNIVCPYTQEMRLVLRGDRTANGSLRYGERGSVNIRVLDAQVDDQTVQVTPTMPDGAINGAASSSLKLRAGNYFAATRNNQLVKGKTFNARIEIEPILPESAARVSALERNESRLTIEQID